MRYILYIFIYLICSSCTKNLEVVNLYDIPDEFIIDLHQVPTSQGTQPGFKISTILPQPCGNYGINVEIIKIGNNVEIGIHDIIEALECDNMSEKISSDVFANMPPNIYNLKISLKDQIFNSGYVTISDAVFKMKLNSENGLSIGKTEILKIPDDHIWGYIKFNNAENKLGISLLDILHPIIDGPSPLYTGDYGLFTLDSSGEIHFPGVDENREMEKIIMKSTSTLTEIKTIVETFKSQHQDIEISISSSYGIIL